MDLQKLFVINDMEELIANEYDKVENGQAAARKLLQQTEEPTMDIWEGCKKPYDCGFSNTAHVTCHHHPSLTSIVCVSQTS